MPAQIILAQDLREPHAAVERIVVATIDNKPLPPQAVAVGQALQCW